MGQSIQARGATPGGYDSSVMNERRIGIVWAHVRHPTICGVPSERGDHGTFDTQGFTLGWYASAPLGLGNRFLGFTSGWYAGAPLGQKIAPTGRCIPARGSNPGYGEQSIYAF